MTISGRVICPVFVGRTTQVASFNKLLADVNTNDTIAPFRVALITGEAGIGKTRFVSEVTATARQQGMTVLQGRCFEHDHALPYAPLVDLLNTFCLGQTREQIEVSLKPSAPELVRIFPELSLYLSDITPLPMLDPEGEKKRIFQALKQFLLCVGVGARTATPLLIVFEDLHWCDDLSLEFFLYLTRHNLPRPMLLVGTYRGDERNESLERLLAEWNRLRMATEIRLPRLSLGESDNMLRAILDAERPLPYDLLEALYRLTEGNPFFLEEALKAMIETGETIPSGQLQVPRTIQLAVQHRLDRLSPAARKLVSLAAVMGRRFNVSLLQTFLDQPPEELARQLRELRDAQMIVEESTDIYAFRHALTREAIYQDILGIERKGLHKTIALAFEQNQAELNDILLNDLSYHFFEAGEWEKAFEYAQRAGERAQSLDATRAALLHFSRALESARHLGMTPPLSLWRARGQCHQTLGNFEAARADYESILQIARESQDRENEWRSLLDLGFAWTSRDYQRAGDYFQQALDVARQLNNPALLAQTLNRIGNWRYMSGDPSEGLVLHREALEIVESLNDLRETASTLDLLGISSYGFGDLLKGGEYYERAIALYRQLGERQGLIACLCAYPISGSSYMTITGVPAPVDIEDLIRKEEEAVGIARQMGWRPNEAYALSFQVISLGPHGEFQRALQAGQQGLSIASEMEHVFFILTARFSLGALYLDLFDFAAAREHLHEAYTLSEKAGAGFVSDNIAGYLAEAHLMLNEIDRAETLLEERLSDETLMNSEARRKLGMARAELLLKKVQFDQALTLVRRMIAATPHTDRGGVSPPLWLLHAQALRALERDLEAEALLREALDTAQSSHLGPLVWRVQIELGMVLRAMRRLTEAQEQWSAARETIRRLGSKISEEPLRENFLERALSLIPSPSVKEKAKIEFSGLTEREREIATLVAGGSSNNQIAESLVLSRRTVEAHVANIMSKLGLRTRAQIAAWAVEKGLVKTE
jgi:DNA-binding CsgD family transcriptional regulator/tetratricopeptide (TPR) repeat protein